MQRYRSFLILLIMSIYACGNTVTLETQDLSDTADHTEVEIDTVEGADAVEALPPTSSVKTQGQNPDEIVQFAKTLIGTPYRYGSINPREGFDCSGFITYVFNHFQIAVPRSSVDFTNVGEEVAVSESKPGDLILFTGTDSTKRVVGHMGIIVNNSDSTRFIHSTSGKAYGVTVTPLNGYYQGRFVKIIRIFK